MLGAIYRASECGFLLWRMGSKGCGGWSAIWVQLSRYGFPIFLVGARRVVGQCLRSVVQRRGASGWWPRGESGWFKEKNHFFFLLLHRVQGGRRKGNSVVQNGTVRSSFFFMYETTSFWIKRVVSIKNGARTCQISNQPSIIFCLFQLCPCQFRSLPP